MPTDNTRMGEMLPLRTKNSKTWINRDGSYTTEVFQKLVHFEDQHGNLQNINTDLYDEADFDLIDEPVAAEGETRFKQSKIEVKAAKNKGILNRAQHNFQGLRVPFDVHVPRNFQRGYTVGKGLDKLTFKPVKSSPAMGELSQTDRSVIVYQDVWNDTDVELKVLPNGLKETLFLKTAKAPTAFTFEVKGKDIAEDFTAGTLKLMPAWLVDAEGTYRDVEQQIIRNNDNKLYVELKADVTDLIFPIEIDPTVTIQPDGTAGKDNYVHEEAPTSNYGSSHLLGIGTNNGYRMRSFLQFDLSSIPLGSAVTSAVLGIYRSSGSGIDSVYETKVFEITAPWSETTSTWNTQPAVGATVYAKHQTTTKVGENAVAMEIKSLVEEWVKGSKVNNGIAIYGDESVSNSDRYFESSDSSNTENRPKLTVIYNQKPSRPNIIAPNGGESWNAEHLITWQAASDPDTATANLQYQVDLSTDDGATWKVLQALTAPGATSLAYNFINEPETSMASISIRAFDGTSYSDWDESAGVFTIIHNKAPAAPLNLSPTGGQARDRAQPVRLSWQHNDPDAGDPQSKFDLQWRKKGTASWTTVTQVSTNQFYDLTGLVRGDHEWRVRTYDQEGIPSPYSDIALFFSGDKPATPTIVSPTNGATVTVANPTVQWSSDSQAMYKITVKDVGGVVVWTEEKASANKAVTISAVMQNQKAYTVELSIKNADGLWSNITQITMNVSFTPPAVPTLSAVSQSQAAIIRLTLGASAPVGTEPAVTHQDVYRRKQGEASWKRIATGAPANGTYTDATAGSGQIYEYFVRAWGNNGTYRDSPVVSSSITLMSIWLMDPLDSASLHRFHYFEPGRSAERVFQGAMMEFEGRMHPLAEFSSREQNKVNVVLQIKKDSIDLAALNDLLGRRTALLYRDAKGRRIFGSIFVLTENETDYGYTVPLEVQAVDYKEEV